MRAGLIEREISGVGRGSVLTVAGQRGAWQQHMMCAIKEQRQVSSRPELGGHKYDADVDPTYVVLPCFARARLLTCGDAGSRPDS